MGMQKISARKFSQLFIVGFVASFLMVIDDMLAFSPLFIDGNFTASLFAIAGIIIATIAEIYIIVRFAQKVEGFKYKKEVASLGLVLIGLLVLLGVI